MISLTTALVIVSGFATGVGGMWLADQLGIYGGAE